MSRRMPEPVERHAARIVGGLSEFHTKMTLFRALRRLMVRSVVDLPSAGGAGGGSGEGVHAASPVTGERSFLTKSFAITAPFVASVIRRTVSQSGSVSPRRIRLIVDWLRPIISPKALSVSFREVRNSSSFMLRMMRHMHNACQA